MSLEINKSLKDEIKNLWWERSIPWFLTLSSTLVLITIAYYLLDNVWWFREIAIENIPKEHQDKYLIHIFHIHISMIKRSIGLFSGFAIMFLGIAVAFYSVKRQTKIDIQSQNITLGLVTASPGIISVIVGALLIAHSISSKDHFESYENKPILKIPSLSKIIKENNS